ncbi:segregation and condensation protein A [Niveispirillum fermenti]|uniref:segregation and condensation protein A n=1 Tax=Niveispirillum fermenti TaxID=1233113 RepID=UPI003A84BD52
MSDAFDAAAPSPPAGDALLLDIDGFEGPIDLLLTLAREQKVDLTRVSIQQLAEQFLAFVAEARRMRLELAADYLVMAAWLAYLKSRLLLPDPQPEEPSAEMLAAALTLRLQRLEAMQGAAARLLAQPRLGRDRFGRGAPEDLPIFARHRHDLSLYDLLKAYGDISGRQARQSPFTIPVTDLYSIEEAVARLEAMLGRIPDWSFLSTLLPAGWRGDGVKARSLLASSFVAALELAKAGRLELRQDMAFAPIQLRARDRENGK